MAVIDLTKAEDRVRLACADTSDLPILTDAVYTYLLTKHSDNEVAATKEAAYLILGQLSTATRERLDRIEFYGNQKFEQYLVFIKEVIKNPNGYLNSAGIYAAGISISDIEANEDDPDIVKREIPNYEYNAGIPVWDSDNYF